MSRHYRDREWLYEHYIVLERPATEIAAMVDCHYSTIYYWLSKHGIPVRDQSEARIVVFKDPEKRKERAKSQANLWANAEYRQNQMVERRSEEWRAKQSQILKKKYQDPEFYERIRQANIRKWQDPKYREKILKAIKARWDDPEYVEAHKERLDKLWSVPDFRKMMSEKAYAWFKELWQNPEFRQRKAAEMSVRVKELWQDPEFRQMQSNKASKEMLERWESEEWRSKMTLVAKELWNDPEYRRKMTALMVKRWQDPEWREFFSAYMVELWKEPEYRDALLSFLQDSERRKKHGVLMQELWQDADFVERVTLDRVEKIRSGYRTDIEEITEHALQTLEVDYEFEHRVGRYCVDFFLPEFQIALECDGEYWHRHRGEKDAERDAYLEERGLLVIHLFGPDIIRDVDGLLFERLLPLIIEPKDRPESRLQSN